MEAVKKLRIKKCRTCKEKFKPFSSLSTSCSPSCAIIEARNVQEKNRRKELKERKEGLKTRSDWIKQVQVTFNKYIRERDKDQPCISCGALRPIEKFTGGIWDCGHYRSVGSAPELRFDENNSHRQCKKCNRDLSGNIVEYRKRLVVRIGGHELEELEGGHPPKKYTIDSLKHLDKVYKQKIKGLKYII